MALSYWQTTAFNSTNFSLTRSYHSLGASDNPYRQRFNRHTRPVLPISLGGLTKTSRVRFFPCKNAAVTSRECSSHCFAEATMNKIRNAMRLHVGLSTRLFANDSSKPRATNLPFNFVEPSCCSFSVIIHFVEITFCPTSSTHSKTELSSRFANSSSFASSTSCLWPSVTLRTKTLSWFS